jgi:hypothetical protein
MLGEWDRQRELLDAESVAEFSLEPSSMFALLAEHRDRLFPSELFADLFPSQRGRPSIPGEVVASVIVLQAPFGYSDREAGDALALPAGKDTTAGTLTCPAGVTRPDHPERNLVPGLTAPEVPLSHPKPSPAWK